MAEDFTYAVTFTGARDGREVIEVTCVPRPDATVVWGKIVVEVTPDLLPTRVLYFDEDQVLARTMTFSDVKTFGARRVPAVMRVVPADAGEFTEVSSQELRYDVPLADDLFTLRNLER